jgi:predicted GH43/DUF377 family glycosyl hydrolase
MTAFATDRLVFTIRDVDLARSPLANQFAAETYVLGAFNPGLTRLPNGNLLLMVRVAEALREPIRDGHIHAIRWEANQSASGEQPEGRYVLDAWPLDLCDTADPRSFVVRGGKWRALALTSLSWLLPVELSPDGLEVIAVDYDRAIAPRHSSQCYGIEDARITRLEDRWLMTTCSVSPERQGTTLYTSSDGRDWQFEGFLLDHQNKDMLIFEGQAGGSYWAQTRPLGAQYFSYPPGSEWRNGPSINLATSPDTLHWRPCIEPGLRPRSGSLVSDRMGGGTPPILTDEGWLTLWHGVEAKEIVGIYRTYWSILDRDEPWKVLRTGEAPLIEANTDLTAPLADLMYLHDVVFTTGIVDAGDHYVVASGEADLACRITHVPKSAFD